MGALDGWPDTVGDSEGVVVGCMDGDADSLAVGDVEGDGGGKTVGKPVSKSETEGAIKGDTDNVGFAVNVGVAECLAEGKAVDTCDSVGLALDFTLGDEDGDAIG